MKVITKKISTHNEMQIIKIHYLLDLPFLILGRPDNHEFHEEIYEAHRLQVQMPVFFQLSRVVNVYTKNRVVSNSFRI